MKVLITGGSGFIGTNLIEYYLNKNITVLNIDIVPPRNKKHLDVWQKGDILEKGELEKIATAFMPTHVVHLAAKTDLQGNTLDDYAANHIGTHNLISVLKKINSVQRVVFTSSMLVCKAGYLPKNYDDYCATTPYGESKAEMERVIKSATHHYGWVIVRPTSIWGPWFGEPYRDFFKRVHQKQFFSIKHRSATKTFGFVLNTVQQLDTLLNAENITAATFYLGDEPPLNINDWANAIAKSYNYKPIVEIPYFIFYSAAVAGDVMNKAGLKFPITTFRLKNMTTNNIIPLADLNQVCGKPKYSLQEAISITNNWLH